MSIGTMNGAFILIFFIRIKLVISQLDFNAGDMLSNCVDDLKYVSCHDMNDCYRSLDGRCNNLCHFTAGAANTKLLRLLEANYADGLHKPHGYPYNNKPSPNLISRSIFEVHEQNSQETKNGMSVLFMTFGQFIDHDISLTPLTMCNVTSCESTNDAYQYPCFPLKFNSTENTCTPFGRSVPICQSPNTTRDFPNVLSSFIDGSGLYGSNADVNRRIRTFQGGLMRMTDDGLLQLLPEDQCKLKTGCSSAGETRLDENIALNSLHTLWIREHNRIAKRLSQINPHWDDEILFAHTRKLIGGLLQHILYEEYLPYLVNLPKYDNYNFEINPAITVPFSTAAFRFGHSLIPNSWAVLDNNFNKVLEDLSLRETLNNITYIRQYGIESIVYGLLSNQSQNLDLKFAHGIARTLDIPPLVPGYRDLIALNIQRGRDHGLQTYGAWRRACNLSPIYTWNDLVGIFFEDAIIRLQQVYADPNEIELYPAGVSELHLPNLQLGPTFECILKDQFTRLRNGDRFFYKRLGMFTPLQLEELQKVTFAKLLCNNLKDIVSIQNNVFKAFNLEHSRRVECGNIPDMSFEPWKE